MKIIALAGAYNSGKTTVLKQVVATIVGAGGRLMSKVPHGRDERCAIMYRGQSAGDATAIIQTICGCCFCRVGLFS